MGLAEKYGTGTLVALNGTVVIGCANDSTAGVNVSGTWVATVVFEGTTDDTTWFTIPAHTAAGTKLWSVPTNQALLLATAGYSQVRLRASAYTSGTVAVAWNADAATLPPVADTLTSGGTQGAFTVGTSAVLAAVGATNLPARRSLSVFNNGTVPLYWGYTSGVTTSSGIPISPQQPYNWALSQDTNIYLISGTAGQDVRVAEGA